MRRFIADVAVVLCVLLFAGCGPTGMEYQLGPEAKEDLDSVAQDELADVLNTLFGTPGEPHAPASVASLLDSPDELAGGAHSYRRLCMHCHGLTGDGNGPTAPFLMPKPRDYRKGIFKFTSTASGAKAKRQDLLRTIRDGVPGTSMPSFLIQYQENPEEIEHVLDYVTLLAIRGETERLYVRGEYFEGDPITPEIVGETVDTVAALWARPVQVVNPKVPRPSPDRESLARGKKLYLSTSVQCFNCHGAEGRGDGLSAEMASDPSKVVDSWGNPDPPLNLTLGFFHGGRRPIDLFRRIHTGVKGTPMPGQSVNLSEKEIWDLVNFVRVLPYVDVAQIGADSQGGQTAGAEEGH